jgi:hypothetical protein
MIAILANLIRYVCWAVVGATLSTALLLYLLGEFNSFRDLVPGLTIFACVGGIVVVTVRLVVGVITRYPPRVADQMTAVVLGRFFIGGVLGHFAVGVFLRYSTWNIDLVRMHDRGWLDVAFCGAGAAATVTVGWLAHRRRGRLLLPVAWLVVFVALVRLWFWIHEQFPHFFKSQLF